MYIKRICDTVLGVVIYEDFSRHVISKTKVRDD
jgi:hypothetical protein